MPYESFEQLANGFSSLRGNQISEAGWDAIAAFAEEEPSFAVIDDCFSEECETAIRDAIKLAHPDSEPTVSTIVKKPELLKPVANFLVGLSYLAVNDTGDVIAFNDIYSKMPAMGDHIDVKSGHTALANFNVSGAPSYVLRPNISTLGERAINPFGEPFKIFGKDESVNPPEHVVPIKSRQLVLLGGNALRAEEIGDGVEASSETLQFGSTIPHAAVVGKQEYRDLLLTYAVHTG